MPSIIRNKKENKDNKDKEKGEEEDKNGEEKEEGGEQEREDLLELQSICISISVLPLLRYCSVIALLVRRNPSCN